MSWKLSEWNKLYSTNPTLPAMTSQEITGAIKYLRDNNYPKPEDCPETSCPKVRPACHLVEISKSKYIKEVRMTKVDITRQCRVELSLTRSNEALVYLYHNEQSIGLFDKYGFHFMVGTNKQYYIEDGYKAHSGIVWFKVYEER